MRKLIHSQNYQAYFAVPFRRVEIYEVDFLVAAFFELPLSGTLAPSFLASDKPIAIACFRLVTVLPLRPLFSSPRFSSCIARSTLSWAPCEYFAIMVNLIVNNTEPVSRRMPDRPDPAFAVLIDILAGIDGALAQKFHPPS